MSFGLAAAATPGIAPSSVFSLSPGTLADPAGRAWTPFAQSWDDLPRDSWMADGGTYRRRRYAAFRVAGAESTRLPHRAHFQERDHNPLNGGVARWFAPMAEATTGSPLFRALLRDTAARIADAAALAGRAWMVEAHQFRIEALPGQPGLPTPEGMHHDGRDWVLILLVGGGAYAGGESRVADASGACLFARRLTRPGEALLLNDRKVRHETTPIEAATPATPAWRDTLVLTFTQTSER
ncbi:MAG: hypothetical protein CMN73_03410 [Sphingomonas sp.]|nr:hypothetical protein [Sphingomonas sp.]